MADDSSSLSRPSSWSMKGYLLFWILIFLIPLRLFTGYLSVERTKYSLERAFDLTIENALHGLASLVEQEQDGRFSLNLSPQVSSLIESSQLDKVYYQVVGPQGETLAGNAVLPLNKDLQDELIFVDTTFNQVPIRLGTLRHASQKNPSQAVFIMVGHTLQGQQQVLSETLLDFIFTLFVTILCLIIVVWMTVKKSITPLADIASNLEARSAADFSPLPSTRLPSEIQPVISSFNVLLKQVEDEISSQKRLLENAAHELKTPLAGIKTLTQLIITEADTNKRDELLSQLKASVDRTSNLTKKLLSASNTTTLVKRTESFAKCNLVHIAKEVVLHYFREAQSLDIDLGYEGPESPVYVWGEDGALHEMISNLVENGLRYSFAGCQVTVRIDAEPTVVLSVIDNGRGIAPEDRSLVFERFYRILGTQVEGSGLGLAIVKEVADAFGGSIKITDGPSGSGCCFSVSFPYAAKNKERASYNMKSVPSYAAIEK